MMSARGDGRWWKILLNVMIYVLCLEIWHIQTINFSSPSPAGVLGAPEIIMGKSSIPLVGKLIVFFVLLRFIPLSIAQAKQFRNLFSFQLLPTHLKHGQYEKLWKITKSHWEEIWKQISHKTSLSATALFIKQSRATLLQFIKLKLRDLFRKMKFGKWKISLLINLLFLPHLVCALTRNWSHHSMKLRCDSSPCTDISTHAVNDDATKHA